MSSFEQRLFLLPSPPGAAEGRVRGRFIKQPIQERRQRDPLTMVICRNSLTCFTKTITAWQ